jgi:hypothetical protein
MTIKCLRDGRSTPGVMPVKSKAITNEQRPDGNADGLTRRRDVDKRTGDTKTTFVPKGAPAKK